MPTFRIEIRKDQKDQEGRAPLRLRISHKNVRRYVPLDKKIAPRHWNDKKRAVRQSMKGSGSFNDYLQTVLQVANEVFTELAKQNLDITSDRIRNRVVERIKPQGSGGDFMTYARSFVEDYKRGNQVSTYKSNTVVLNKLEKFMPGLSFDDITPEFLRRFDVHLREKYGNNLNTRSKNLSKIRTILYAAIREGQFSQDKNPFFHVKLKTKDVIKEHLKQEEIDRIIALDLTKGSAIWDARNYFMFAYYMFGIRISDVLQLKPENIIKDGDDERAKFEMDKTEKNHGILIMRPAREIMDLYKTGRFIFPALEGYDISNEWSKRSAIESRTAAINDQLKKVMELADVTTNVSTHIARHSITGKLISEGWTIYDISKALGHSSIKQTETYLRGFDFADYLDDKVKKLWD